MEQQHTIKVSSETPCNKLAGSLKHQIEGGKTNLVIRAIGPKAVSQAIKAVSILSRISGVTYCVIPRLCTETIPDRETGEQMEWVVTTLEVRRLDNATPRSE